MKIKFMVRQWAKTTLRPIIKRYEDLRDNENVGDDQQEAAIACLTAIELCVNRLGESAPYIEGTAMEKLEKLREAIKEYRYQSERPQIDYVAYKNAIDNLDIIMKETA